MKSYAAFIAFIRCKEICSVSAGALVVQIDRARSKKRRTDRNGLYADMHFERMLFADLDAEQFGSVAVHQAAVIIGREQLFHFMEVFLIKRALTCAVVQIGVRTVDRAVAAEHGFSDACCLYQFHGAFQRHPCGIAVKIGQFCDQVDGFEVVGAKSHMHHDEFCFRKPFGSLIDPCAGSSVRTARMHDDRQSVMFRKLNERRCLFGIKGDVGMKGMEFDRLDVFSIVIDGFVQLVVRFFVKGTHPDSR